jgi:secreted PhoX family phosphatase
LIAQNHEYTDEALLFPDGRAAWNEEKTRKSLAAHGVSLIEVRKVGDQWQVVRPSKYARRISGLTPIAITGPAAGDVRLKTRGDSTGRKAIGTLNNCAVGKTPWGTFLTCEENFNVYFYKSSPLTELEKRYGANAANYGYAWHTSEPRFRVDKEPNEPNRFGWVVEIDPFDPTSVPNKRTALGRFKHEGACVQEAEDGRVVVYSGDDEQFEYIYRYVSRLPWRESFAKGIHPLDDGMLSVARFEQGGRGEWVALAPSQPLLAGWSIQDILINARGAADRVGATKLDRPEWITANVHERTVFASLTNNVRRGTEGNPDCDSVNPRATNVFGQILRWKYDTGFGDPMFQWDIFALAGDPANPEHGATVVGDKYGSPDGLYVAPSGRLWIQTDVSSKTMNVGAYAGFGNNQMLCADPRTKETRRFLQGPMGCEVAGVMVTPDERTMFVGIQHPGEAPTGANEPSDPKRHSSWPDGPSGGRPRSSLLVITKDDGGEIGS